MRLNPGYQYLPPPNICTTYIRCKKTLISAIFNLNLTSLISYFSEPDFSRASACEHMHACAITRRLGTGVRVIVRSLEHERRCDHALARARVYVSVWVQA